MFSKERQNTDLHYSVRTKLWIGPIRGKTQKNANAIRGLYLCVHVSFYFLSNGLSSTIFVFCWHAKAGGVNVNWKSKEDKWPEWGRIGWRDVRIMGRIQKHICKLGKYGREEKMDTVSDKRQEDTGCPAQVGLSWGSKRLPLSPKMWGQDKTVLCPFNDCGQKSDKTATSRSLFS